MIGGNVYSCTLFHSKVYGKLSKQFVYVDGTLNRDGKQYFGKRDYVPYSNWFLYQKYNIKRGGIAIRKIIKRMAVIMGKEGQYTVSLAYITHFLNYQSFRERADFVGRNYPPELPAVAEDIRYYYGRSGIVINAGMSFTVSGNVYQKLKETYLSRYEEWKEEYLRESQQSLEDDQKSCKEWETSGGTIYEFNRTVTSEIFKEGGAGLFRKDIPK